MQVKGIVDEDFVNYKKPSMFIATSKCDFKCDKEAGCQVCQNSDLANSPTIEIDPVTIVQRFNSNPITEAIVFGGLEPLYGSGLNHCGSFDSFSSYILELNKGTDIVVYTGYYPSEIHYSSFQFWYSMTNAIKGNLIFKFGRFIPDRPHRFDEVLGVELASDNQFAINLMEIEAEYAIDMWRELIEIERKFRK